MTTPLFLATFNDSLAFQDRSGGGTFTATGAVAYTDGMVDRAYRVEGSTYVSADEGGRIDLERGAIAVRFAVDAASAAGSRYIFGIGEYGVAGKDWIGTRVAPTTSMIDMVTRAGNVLEQVTLSSGVTASAMIYHTAYIEWDGQAIGIRVDGSAMQTGTRSVPLGDITTTHGIQVGRNGIGNAGLAGSADDLSIYPAPLSTGEQDMIFDTDRPWTWDMLASLAPRPSRVFVLGSPHNIGPLRVGRR